MNTTQFDSRIRHLESLTGSETAMDLFNEAYQSLLLEVQRLPKAKAEKLERMRRLLHRQFLFLLAAWHRAKAIDKMGGSGQEEIEAWIKGRKMKGIGRKLLKSFRVLFQGWPSFGD